MSLFLRAVIMLNFFLLACFRIVVVGILLLSLGGFLGELSPYLELTCHFKVQYFVASCSALIFFVAKRQKWWVLISAACLGLNLLLILPWYLPAPVSAATPTHSLRVLLANVNVKNQDYAATIALIREEKPDVAVIVETNRQWLQALTVIQDQLPQVLQSPSAAGFGTAIYSRFPLHEIPRSPLDPLTNASNSRIVASLSIPDKTITVVALHPPPPLKGLVKQRNQELQVVSDYVRQLEQAAIALGDFNTSLWSPYYQKFEHNSGLRNSRQGFGILPTWTTRFPPLLIPIDHCLISSEFKVVNIRTGKNINSDHLPLIVALAF